MPRLGRAPGPGAAGRRAQKKSRRATEQDRPGLKAERAAWREEFAAIDPARLVFVDETGASAAMDRTHGRSPSGVRVGGPVPQGRWKMTTLTAAVRLDGVPPSACLAFDGPTDAAASGGYVGDCLVPALRPGDIVVLDDLSCHKSPEVERLVRTAGAEVRYLPAYSPDLNPIEQPFSEPKAWLRSAAARTVDASIAAMGDAVRAVRPSDILGWFRHSGYPAEASTVTIHKKPLWRHRVAVVEAESHADHRPLPHARVGLDPRSEGLHGVEMLRRPARRLAVPFPSGRNHLPGDRRGPMAWSDAWTSR